MVSSIAPDHPEATCRRCGGPNVCWYAPSPLWNAVMRDEEPRTRPERFSGIVCPTCFCVLTAESGLEVDGFRVDAAKQPAGLSLTTADGRVWDADRDLWVSS